MTPTVTTAEMREKLKDPKFDYVLACAEFCGQAHWNMKVTVVVESEEEYNQWLATNKPIYESLVNVAENNATEATEVKEEKKEVVEKSEAPKSPISALRK
jgi:cytochrome c oxidase subunit 2